MRSQSTTFLLHLLKVDMSFCTHHSFGGQVFCIFLCCSARFQWKVAWLFYHLHDCYLVALLRPPMPIKYFTQVGIYKVHKQESEGSHSLLATSELALCSMYKRMLQVHEVVPGSPLLIKLVGLIPGDELLRGSIVLLQSVGSRQFLQHELLQLWPLSHQENAKNGAIQEDKLLELMGTLVVLKPWLAWKCSSLEENFRLPNFVPRALCDTSPWNPGDSKIGLSNIVVIS